MDIAAKKTAFSRFLLNVGGVLLSLPILYMFGHRLAEFDQHPAIALANIHLVFNVTASLVFTIFISPFTRFVDYLFGKGKMDFERIEIPTLSEQEGIAQLKEKLDSMSLQMFLFLKENYNIVTLSVETNYKVVFEAADKRLDYIDFVKKQYLNFFTNAVTVINKEDESKILMATINEFDYLFQIHDSIKDLFESKRIMNDKYIELKSDLLLLTRGLAIQT